jgi:hypothetical protein
VIAMPSSASRRNAVALTSSAIILPFVRPAQSAPAAAQLLDDFSSGTGATLIGTQWHGFTDQVMGGRSLGGIKPDVIDGRRCLRLLGRVDTRGGGFVQMAVDLTPGGKPLAVGDSQGFEIDVFGNGESYNAHIRTTDVNWYDQSYRARFDAPPTWTTVRLPWSAFQPNGLDVPLKTDQIIRLGLLGWMRDFDVDLAISRLALF